MMRVKSLSGLSLVAMLAVVGFGVPAPVGSAQDAGRGAPRGVPAATGRATQARRGASASGSGIADAVQRRDTQAVQALLKNHADVNAPQSDGATALHWAAYLEDADTTALLIRAGANVNAQTTTASRRWRSPPRTATPTSSSSC